MHRIYRFQISLLLLCTAWVANAQENLPLYDFKKLHFGFTIGGSQSSFRLRTSESFLQSADTLKGLEVKPFIGLHLSGIADYKIGEHFNLRILPGISFAERNIQYTFILEKQNRNVKIESTYFQLPLLLKYKSKRYRNVRFYTIAGASFYYDLSSKKDAPRSLGDPVVALQPETFNYEIGLGLDLYWHFFKFSPEIKVVNSMGSVLVRDGYVFTESIGELISRVIYISFHFE